MSSTPLAIEDVHKSYDGQKVLKNISFELVPGEIFGLIGLNGAGKTTLIKIILDLINADQGKASIFGIPTTNLEARRTCRTCRRNSSRRATSRAWSISTWRFPITARSSMSSRRGIMRARSISTRRFSTTVWAPIPRAWARSWGWSAPSWWIRRFSCSTSR